MYADSRATPRPTEHKLLTVESRNLNFKITIVLKCEDSSVGQSGRDWKRKAWLATWVIIYSGHIFCWMLWGSELDPPLTKDASLEESDNAEWGRGSLFSPSFVGDGGQLCSTVLIKEASRCLSPWRCLRGEELPRWWPWLFLCQPGGGSA